MGHWSYWEKSSFAGKNDVIIIGAGITGLNAALFLKKSKPNLKVIVLERGILPAGASTKNAGFACFGSLSELIADANNLGEDNMLTLVEKRWQGLNLLRENIGDKGLDFQRLGGYEIFTDRDQKSAQCCLENLTRYNELLGQVFKQPVFSNVSSEVPSFGLTGITGLVKNQFEGQIDTGKMMKALLQKCSSIGVDVRFGMEVTNIDQGKIETKVGLSFSAEKIIVATNGFAKQFFDLPLAPARAQVLVTKPIVDLKIEGTFHYDQGYFYFRNIHDRLLIGGGRNLDFKGEETSEMTVTDNIQSAIKDVIDQHILKDVPYELDYAWSGVMGVGKSKEPIVKKISDQVYVAVRLGGMGVAIGSLVGQEAGAMVLGE